MAIIRKGRGGGSGLVHAEREHPLVRAAPPPAVCLDMGWRADLTAFGMAATVGSVVRTSPIEGEGEEVKSWLSSRALSDWMVGSGTKLTTSVAPTIIATIARTSRRLIGSPSTLYAKNASARGRKGVEEGGRSEEIISHA